MDVRVGGKHLFCMEMKTPEGSRKMWSTGEYMEVVPSKRLVYTESMVDENGIVLLPSALGMGEDYPMTTEITVLLEELNGRTKMVMTHAGLPAGRQGASYGWEQAFTKMADLIKTILKDK